MQFWDLLMLIGSVLALVALIWILILDARDARRSARVHYYGDETHTSSITSVIGTKKGAEK